MEQEKKSFFVVHWFKVFIAVAITTVIGFYLYQNYMLHSCIADADKATLSQWQEECSRLKRGKNCDMNATETALIDVNRTWGINFCFRLYSFKLLPMTSHV